MKKMKISDLIFNIIKYASLILASIVALVPVCVCILTAFKTNDEYKASSVLDLPKSFTYIENFKIAFEKANMLRCFANTALVLIVVLTVSVFIGSMLAYGKLIPWDFQKYRPDVVLVAIGQNDNHPEDYMKEDYQGEKAIYWRKHYKQFLICLREKYPEAYIICHTTLLCHDISWDNAIDEVVKSLNDKKISHYIFKRNGCGTPGHLRIPEAEEMAEELLAYIKKLTGWE